MKKGFSLVTLLVTIFVIITLSSTVVISANSVYNSNKKIRFASEISYIKELVNNYMADNNGKLPSSSDVVVSTKSISKEDLNTQFAGETISEDTIFLNKIDMSMINPGTLQYGNGTDEKSDDIYCISKQTGKIYYIRGCKIGTKIYYTLNDELKKSIKYTESNNVNDGIIFYDGNLDNGIKEIDIKIPESYLDVELASTDVSFEYSSENQSGYNIYKTKSKENSIISVKYKVNNDSEKKELKYNVEGVDNSGLTFSLSDVKKSINSSTQKEEKYITIENLSKKDNQIKMKKYSNIYIDKTAAKDYFKNSGIDIKDNIISLDNSLGNMTVYVEDNSGNYHIEYVTLNNTTMGYINNGMVLLLDGIRNTRSGHSANTNVWEDLSGNNYDYTLNDIKINDNNIYFKGTANSYALRKENLSEIFGNTLYDDRTIEIVVKDTSDSHIWICGNSSSRKAIGIYVGALNVSISPDNVSTFTLKSSALKVNNYSILHKKEGEICVYQNDEQLVKTNNLNCWNHSGEVSYIGNSSTNGAPLNGEIYSIRVYNRILTEREIKNNYEVDKIRYNIK